MYNSLGCHLTYKRWSNPLACREKSQPNVKWFTCGFRLSTNHQDVFSTSCIC